MRETADDEDPVTEEEMERRMTDCPSPDPGAESVLGANVTVVVANYDCPVVFARRDDAIAEYRKLVSAHERCMEDSGETAAERAFLPGRAARAGDQRFWCECDDVIGLFQTTLVLNDPR